MRILKIIGWSAIALLIVIAALVAALLAIDPSVYRTPLQARLSTALGRSVALRGPMSLRVGWSPGLAIEDVSIANPKWASRAEFAHADRLQVQIVLTRLLRGELRIASARVEGLELLLEVRADGTNNWTFAGAAGGAAAPPPLESYSCDNCVITYRNASGHEQRLTIAAAAGVFAPTEAVQLLASGSYRGQPFTLSLLGGTPLELATAGTPWPAQAKLQVGGASLKTQGQIQRTEATLNVELSGDELSELTTLAGVSVSPLGAYELSLQLAIAKHGVRISALKGFVGPTEQMRRFTLREGSMQAAADEPFELRTDGKYGDAPFTLTVAGGTVGALHLPAKPWPLELNATAGGAKLSVRGTITDALTAANLELAASLQGKQLGELGVLTGTTLPALGPYALTARVSRRESSYAITGIAGFLGPRGSAQHVMLSGGELRLPAGKALQARLQGSYGGLPLRLALTGGTWPDIAAPQEPWPIALTVSGGGATIAIRGSVARPLTGENFDVDVSTSGHDLAQLSPLFGRALPPVASYQLTARVHDAGGTYVATGVRARVDESDIAGTLSLDRNGPRPKLIARLTSQRLDVDKLILPEATAVSGDRSQSWIDRPLPIDRLQIIDLDLDVKVRELAGAPTAVRDTAFTAWLEDGKATLRLAGASLPGMTLAGRGELDAHGKKPSFVVALSSKNAELQRALKEFAHAGHLAVSGSSRLSIDLASRGDTPRELIEHASLKLAAEAIEARFGDGTDGRAIPIKISTAEATTAPGQPVSIQAEGVIRNLAVDLHIVTATLLRLADDRTNWPISVEVRAAGNLFSIKGVVARPFEAEGFDVTFDFRGQELKTLGSLFDLELPVLGRYELSGRFVNGGGVHQASGLQIGVGKHRASGSVKLITGPRPHIVAELRAGSINIDELAQTPKAQTDGAPAQASDGRVIPDLPIPREWLRKLDVEFDADIPEVISESLDIGDLTIKATLEHGHLRLSTLRTTLFDGTLDASMDVDVAGDTPTANVRLTVRHLDYGRWLRAWRLTDQVDGTVDTSVSLDGRGATLRALLGDANGAAVLVSGPAQITGEDFGLWGAGITSSLMSITTTALGLKKSTKFNCMVWPFNVTDGVASSDAILLDTPSITVSGRGTISLATEEMDLVLRPARKKASLFSFENPVQITGTLQDPKRKTLDKASTVGKIVLPFVNPAFLLLSVRPGTGEHNPCVAAVRGEGTKRKSKGPREVPGLAGELLKAMQEPDDNVPAGAGPSDGVN